jgi:hypothetical protein
VFDGGDHKGVPVAFSVGDRALETVIRERPEEWPGVCTVGQGVSCHVSGTSEDEREWRSSGFGGG